MEGSEGSYKRWGLCEFCIAIVSHSSPAAARSKSITCACWVFLLRFLRKRKSRAAVTKNAAVPPTTPPTMAPTSFLELPSWSLPSLGGSVVVGGGPVVEVLVDGVVSGSLPTDSAICPLSNSMGWFGCTDARRSSRFSTHGIIGIGPMRDCGVLWDAERVPTRRNYESPHLRRRAPAALTVSHRRYHRIATTPSIWIGNTEIRNAGGPREAWKTLTFGC